jgi:hypothetical protein
MARIYCNIDQVKRLLRTGGTREAKVRFSDAYRDLKSDEDNQGDISLSGIVFNSAWAGHEDFTFEFTDSTSFDVIGNVIGSLGNGTIQSSFVSADRFTVSADKWNNVAEIGDKWYISSISDISDDDGDEFITDNCKRINAKLEKTFGSLSSIDFYSSPAVSVPDAIEFACIRYTAYDIWNSIYSGQIPPGEDSPVEVWKKAADEAMENYTYGHGSGPRWKSRDSLVTELGVDGIGDGVIEIDSLTDSANKDYRR